MNKCVYGVKGNVVAILSGLVADGERGMCFASTWRTDEDKVVETINPFKLGQRDKLLKTLESGKLRLFKAFSGSTFFTSSAFGL